MNRLIHQLFRTQVFLRLPAILNLYSTFQRGHLSDTHKPNMTTPSPHPNDHIFDPGDMASLAYQTNIDRRHNTRTVPLRVLCLGLSRTGTVSLRQALIRLGYKDCYHFASTLQENPADTVLWTEALQAKFLGVGKPYGKAEWDALLGHCQAVTDTPCIIFYKELLAAYPDAKVILTERDDADAWFRSQMRTVVPYSAKIIGVTWLDKLKGLFSPLDSTVVNFFNLIISHAPAYKALWHDYYHGTETAKRFYDDYNAEIKRIVPKENLLVFNLKEGWEPLCNFLGEQVPKDEEFPRRNETTVFVKNNEQFMGFVQAAIQKKMTMVGAGVFATVALGVAALMAKRR